MSKKIIKKVPYGRILFDSYHVTKGWRIRKASQEVLTSGYNKLIEFLSKGK